MAIRRRRLVLFLLGVLVSASLAAYAWHHFRSPPLPVLHLEGKDPAVAASIQKALNDVRASPRSGVAWGRLGMVLHVHQVTDAARDCYRNAHRFDPNNPGWPYLQGLALLPDAPAALPWLEDATRLADRYDSENDTPRLLLAEVLFLLGRHSDAKAELERVAEHDSANARAAYNLGLVALAADDVAAARAYFEASAHDPACRKKSAYQLATALRTLAERGDAAHRQQARTAAAKAADAAASAPDDRPWPDPYREEASRLAAGRSYFLQLSEELLQQGRSAEARQLMQRVVREFPDDATYLELAKVMVTARDYEAAEEAARAALDRSPDQVQAHYLLGQALFRQAVRLREVQGPDAEGVTTRFSDAEKHLASAVQRMPEHAGAHLYRGRCLRYLGRHAEAAEAFRTAVRNNPRQPEGYVFLSNLLAEDGNKTEAARVLEQARTAVPESVAVRRALERLRAMPPTEPRHP